MIDACRLCGTPHALVNLRFLANIDELPATDWDQLAGDEACLQHAYLAALQESSSIGPGTGWTAHYAVLEDSVSIRAAMPLFVKEHSYGEYVFDWAWAEAYARAGLEYYPKWLGASPFTPIPGSRLLGKDQDARLALLRAVLKAAAQQAISSLHLLFLPAEEAAWAEAEGMFIREGVQFHWQNQGYPDFEAFLGALNHDKRKKIRQERKRLLADGQLSFHWLDGHTARQEDWVGFYSCYVATYRAHRSHPYLTPKFFLNLASARPDMVRLLRVDDAAGACAYAFFLLSADRALHGRYWGALRYIPGLHFEACYYRPIEYAIAQQLATFEGGAQGEHKLARGLAPTATYSAHWVAEPTFRRAIGHWVTQERRGMAAYVDELEQRAPYRRLELDD